MYFTKTGIFLYTFIGLKHPEEYNRRHILNPNNAKKHLCPHCGKFIKSGGGIPVPFFILVLLLCAGFFLWTSGKHSQANVSGQPSAIGKLYRGVPDYITSPEADKSCGVCLASANSFLASKKQATIREKTKDMAGLPAGEYQIGSPDGLGDADEHPRHLVHLDAFYIDKYEVTTADYMKFTKDNYANYPEWAMPEGKFNIDTGKNTYYRHLSAILKTCTNCPIVGVTAQSAEAYCKSKNRRLPTEAEWEAAARGGADSAFSFGETAAMAGDYAWYETTSEEKPHPVGTKKPNKYGIYDMYGNVWEWISDIYSKDYYSESTKINPKGPTAGRGNIIRGGSWASDANSMRSGNRASTFKPNDDIGFRCAVSESALLDEGATSPVAVEIASN
ncbi:MAG TPA: hypothetical protein DCL44_09950 [Elusimicrobia bacterium]|nr:hypothetical protein [Elusimicrobiota bacterium]